MQGKATMSDRPRGLLSAMSRWCVNIILLLVLYVMSSGPVLAIAFRLREATGWDGFYAVMFVYYPIAAMGHGGPLSAYIEWWVVDVFNTVGPG